MGKKKKNKYKESEDHVSSSGSGHSEVEENEYPPTIPRKRKSSFEGFEVEQKKLHTSTSPSGSSHKESNGRSSSPNSQEKVNVRNANIKGLNQSKIIINESININNIPEYARFIYMKPVDDKVNLRSFSVIIQKTFKGLLRDDIKSAIFCRNGQLLIEAILYRY